MKRTLLMSFFAIALAGHLLWLAGCDQPSDETNTPPVPSPAETSDSSAGAADVDVQLKTWEETQQLVADRRGQVVVVDLWTSW